MIPPHQDADFVAHMEYVLDVYHQPYAPSCPMICMDEQPIQMLKETRDSIPMQPGEVERCDYQYERAGVANAFMFCEPLAGKRYVSITEHRTAVDWAHQIQYLLDVRYPTVPTIRLVMDQLNTHNIGSLYKTFPAEKARRLAQRLDIHHTPKHGSWLNIAEIELSCMTKQCLKDYIPDIETLASQTTAWFEQRNQDTVTVDWQFSTEQARTKLKRLYPVFSD